MRVKGTAEQRRTDGVAHGATLLGFEFKIGVVRSQLHALAAAAELKRPRARDDASFELELAGQTGPNGSDAFHRLVTNAFVGNERCRKTAHGDGGLVDQVDHDEDHVVVIVVNLHAHGNQMSVEGAGTGAVVFAHQGSPVPTVGWLYFNGLLLWRRNQRKRRRVSEGKDQSTAATVWWVWSTLVRYSLSLEPALKASRRPNQRGPTTGSM
jgi:hypothetical protein